MRLKIPRCFGDSVQHVPALLPFFPVASLFAPSSIAFQASSCPQFHQLLFILPDASRQLKPKLKPPPPLFVFSLHLDLGPQLNFNPLAFKISPIRLHLSLSPSTFLPPRLPVCYSLLLAFPTSHLPLFTPFSSPLAFASESHRSYLRIQTRLSFLPVHLFPLFLVPCCIRALF